MSSPLEIMQAAQKFDPYGSFREGQMQATQYDIKQMGLEEQARELKQEQEQAQQQPTATGGTAPGIGQQAKVAYPNWKLTDDNGMPTVAGQINDYTIQAGAAVKDSDKLLRQARFETDPVRKERLTSEGRRLRDEAMKFKKSAGDLANKTQNDAIYGLATAANQSEWDNIIKGWERNGFPVPQGFPTEYSPENLKKVQQMAPAELQSKINTDLRNRAKEAEESKLRKLRINKLEAAERDGVDTGGPTYETVEEKLNDPKFGVAKGKIPAKEQTIARRITADSSEVLIGVNQLAHLTNGGKRDLTGSTFSEARGDGFLKAPAKAFTNKISKDDSLMYDSIMYPIVKNMSLFDNPDYRPTDADVKQKMQAYKAGANEPRAVQLQKMAELKNTYMAKAEAYLDAGILNANQAASLKKQMRGIEKAIPWNVNDAIDFSRQKEYKKFEDFLNSKKEGGSEPAPATEKPESKAPPAKPKNSTVTVGGKVYKRSDYPNMSDSDWNDYANSIGK